jgi:hypothetical protein
LARHQVGKPDGRGADVDARVDPTCGHQNLQHYNYKIILTETFLKKQNAQ